jgi:hypothetical protein
MAALPTVKETPSACWALDLDSLLLQPIVESKHGLSYPSSSHRRDDMDQTGRARERHIALQVLPAGTCLNWGGGVQWGGQASFKQMLNALVLILRIILLLVTFVLHLSPEKVSVNQNYISTRMELRVFDNHTNDSLFTCTICTCIYYIIDTI